MKLKFHNGTNVQLFTKSEVKNGEKEFTYQLAYNGKVIATVSKDNISSSVNPEKIETKKNAINCIIKDEKVLYNDDVIITGTSLIKDQFGDLVKEGEKVIVKFDDLILGEFDLNDFSDDLFKRRNSFKVKIIDDNNFKVIRYANLHQHSEYSLSDAIARVKDVAKATEYSCALTDHGNMYGFREFYKAMKNEGKHPIIGTEAYIETLNDETIPTEENDFLNYKRTYFQRNHIILLAKNNAGLKNLYKISTESYDNIYSKPHVTYDMLRKYHEGIICTTACMSGVIGKPIQKQNFDLANKVIEELKDIFGDDFYIEIQNHKDEKEAFVMNMARVLAKKHNVKMTVGIDAHYIKPEQSFAHELWLCNREQTNINDPNRSKYIGEGYYVMSSDEVVELFKDIPEALDNTLEIADKCNVTIEFEGYHLPDFQIPSEFKTQADYFKYLCREGYKRLFKETDKYKNPIYLQRMQDEIKVITGYATGEYNPNADWSGYLLIVQDLINWAKEKGIYCGPGRGSAAGSLVAYCLGITDVDPIADGLLFERFMSPDRISMPDIDTDYQDDRREEVIDYAREKYGFDHVSRIITFISATAKAIVRLVCRVLDKPISLGDKIAKTIPNKPKMTLKKAFEESPAFAQLYEEEAECKEVIDYAMTLEGLKTAVGIHACGVLITPDVVSEFMPQVKIKDDDTGIYVPTTQITMTECEDAGCLKMDFLGLRNLGVVADAINSISTKPRAIERALERIENDPKKHHVSPITLEMLNSGNIDFDRIPRDDLRVYEFLSGGDTNAVFQYESPYMRGLCQELLQDIETNPSLDGEACFNRLSDGSALGRPGPMAEIPHYIENMLNPDKVHYEVDKMKDFLAATFGVIVYQEQAMTMVRELAGFSGGQADLVRKGMAKKKDDILTEYGNYFIYGSVEKNIKGCLANGIPENVAKSIWDKMVEFGRYAFNKSHSIAYTVMTARTAWLLYYFPQESMMAVLNSFLSNAKKLEGYIAVTKKKGIQILPPDINKSGINFAVDYDDIRFGLKGLRNVRKNSDEIIAEREKRGEFKTLLDFVLRMVRYQTFRAQVYESLVYSGSFDSFEGTRADKISILEDVKEVAKKEKELYSKNQMNLSQLARMMDMDDVADKMDERNVQFISNKPELPFQELMSKEKHYAGFYITGHPLDDFAEEIAKEDITEISFLNVFDDELEGADEEQQQVSDEKAMLDGSLIKVAGIIQDYEIKHTKAKKEAMSVFELEDTTGTIRVVAFPKKHAEFSHNIKKGAVVMIKARVKIDDFGVQLQLEELTNLEKVSAHAKIRFLTLRGSSEKQYAQYQFVKAKEVVKGMPEGDAFVYFVFDGKIHILSDEVTISLDDLTALQKIVGEQNCSVKY